MALKTVASNLATAVGGWGYLAMSTESVRGVADSLQRCDRSLFVWVQTARHFGGDMAHHQSERGARDHTARGEGDR